MFDLYTENLHELHDTVYDFSQDVFELARKNGIYNPTQVYTDILSEILQALTAVYDEVKDRG